MDFTIEQHLTGTPDAVVAALLDPAFITARASLPFLGGAELVESAGEGNHPRQAIRMRFVGELPSAVTAVVDPDKLVWVDDATYDVAACRADHVIRPESYADRLTCSYVATVEAEGAGGARRVLAGRLKVRMPLVGGRVERVIVDGLRDYFAAEATLLDDWLAR